AGVATSPRGCASRSGWPTWSARCATPWQTYSRPSPTDATMARILVIDDDVAQLTVARLALELSGHTVETAQGGLAALAAVTLLGSTAVDAVILDLEMPGLGGVEVAAILKRTPGWEAVPFALVSVRDDVERVAADL